MSVLIIFWLIAPALLRIYLNLSVFWILFHNRKLPQVFSADVGIVTDRHKSAPWKTVLLWLPCPDIYPSKTRLLPKNELCCRHSSATFLALITLALLPWFAINLLILYEFSQLKIRLGLWLWLHVVSLISMSAELSEQQDIYVWPDFFFHYLPFCSWLKYKGRFEKDKISTLLDHYVEVHSVILIMILILNKMSCCLLQMSKKRPT